MIKRLQDRGKTVAMAGDGVNDAALPLAAAGLLSIAGAAMAFSSVFVGGSSLRRRRFTTITQP